LTNQIDAPVGAHRQTFPQGERENRKTTITQSIVVARPVEEVFAFVTDGRDNLRWQTGSGLERIHQTPEDPVGVGTRITEDWRFMGRTSESTSEVTEYEPNKKYTRRLIAGTSPITRGEYSFASVAEGTMWTFTVTIQASGLFAIAEPLLANNLKHGMAANMAAAKTLLEQPATNRAS
jgi:uncharacterized protein YndB with AHSA1/START domain